MVLLIPVIDAKPVIIGFDEKIIYEEIVTATTSNLTKSKIKELLNDGRVRTMELGTIEY